MDDLGWLVAALVLFGGVTDGMTLGIRRFSKILAIRGK